MMTFVWKTALKTSSRTVSEILIKSASSSDVRDCMVDAVIRIMNQDAPLDVVAIRCGIATDGGECTFNMAAFDEHVASSVGDVYLLTVWSVDGFDWTDPDLDAAPALWEQRVDEMYGYARELAKRGMLEAVDKLDRSERKVRLYLDEHGDPETRQVL